MRKELTAASVLYPHLALFAKSFGNDDVVTRLGELQTEQLPHCNFQIWVPNARSEQKLWSGQRTGSALGGLKIRSNGNELLAAVRREAEATGHYTELSAIKLDQLPFFLLACRFFRYPPPPQSWLPIIDEMITPVKGWEWARKRMGGVNLVKRAARLSVAWPSLMSGEE